MSTESQAKDVLEALEKKPGLLYEIYLALKERYDVATPWALEDDFIGRFNAADLLGEAVAIAEKNEKTGAWIGEALGVQHEAATKKEAMAWADGILREEGWVLP